MSNDQEFHFMKNILKQINQQLHDNTEFMTSISERLNIQRNDHIALQQQFFKEKYSLVIVDELKSLKISISRLEKEIDILKSLFSWIRNEHSVQTQELKEVKTMVTANITIPDLLLKEISELTEITQEYFNTLLVDGKPPKKVFSKLDKELSTNLILEMLRRRAQHRRKIVCGA